MMGVMADPLVAKASGKAATADFSAWMSAEQRRIFLLCNRFLQDRDDADSATQDVFLKAYQALQKDQEIEEPGKWLTRIAVNTCLDRLRSRKWQFWRKRPAAEDEVKILEFAAGTGISAEASVYGTQVGARLQQALGRLSARQRAVFTLRHFEDLSLEEIAVTLNLDIGTVKAHMFRAVSKLREELRDLYEGRRREK